LGRETNFGFDEEEGLIPSPFETRDIKRTLVFR